MDNWWLLLVEAALALGLFIFIIWWTMFSGKKKDKHHEDHEDRGDTRENTDNKDNQ